MSRNAVTGWLLLLPAFLLLALFTHWPVIGTVCTSVKCISPVPGGISIIR